MDNDSSASGDIWVTVAIVFLMIAIAFRIYGTVVQGGTATDCRAITVGITATVECDLG